MLAPVVRHFARAGGKENRGGSQSGKDHPHVTPNPPVICTSPHGVSFLHIIHHLSPKITPNHVVSPHFSSKLVFNSTWSFPPLPPLLPPLPHLLSPLFTTPNAPKSYPFSVIHTRPQGLCFFYFISFLLSSPSNTTSFFQVSVLVSYYNTTLQQLGSSKSYYLE